MKIIILMLLLGVRAFSQDSREFNQLLVNEMKKDIENQNDFNLMRDKRPLRAPASREVNSEVEIPRPKVHSKDRQLGGDNW